LAQRSNLPGKFAGLTGGMNATFHRPGTTTTVRNQTDLRVRESLVSRKHVRDAVAMIKSNIMRCDARITRFDRTVPLQGGDTRLAQLKNGHNATRTGTGG
jgi:hypothetical protein